MKMQKYYDRDRFTYNEKLNIAQKSNECCCHCGKKVYFGYGATVDHFVPLNKGGSNQFINLIMLCNDCNQEKDDKLMNIDYVKYLKDEHKAKLKNYVESYIHVMDTVQRNRLLAYDEYEHTLKSNAEDYFGHKKLKKPIVTKYKIKLATWEDLPKLHEYLIKYLKKYDALDSEDAAKENIIFWLQFGCIYYIEKNNEISCMFAITIKQVSEDEGFRGNTCLPYMYIFSYYANEIASSMVINSVINIPLHIIEESDLDYLPFNVLLLKQDKMINKLSYFFNSIPEDDIVNGFMNMHYLVGDVCSSNDDLTVQEMNESELKTYNYLKKFEDITSSILKYFDKYNDPKEIGWMINGLMSISAIAKTPLINAFNISYVED